VGSFEREVTLSSTVDKTYIGDHTIKMKAHVGSLDNQSPFQHVLRDHLGSVDTLMDAKTGAVLQHRGYDVFGRPRDIASGNTLLSGTNWQGVTKGYTDHEHLIDQELIHMNGRIYDFNIGRFLSVDPFLQFPENSQSANPYSYILNNPMRGTDPTGYSAVRGGNASAWATNEFMGDMYSFRKTVEEMQYNKAMKALKKSTSNGEKNEEKSTGNGSKKHEDEGASDTHEQEKNVQGTHSPRESNTYPKERNELEDKLKAKLKALNIIAGVVNKNGGFERRDDAAAWYHNNVNSLAIYYDTEIGAEIFKNSYWTGEELVDKYYLGIVVTSHMRNQVDLSGSVNNPKLNISGRWHSHGPDPAPFTIGADTDWADQIDSRAAYLSRANNYLLKSYVLQKYSKGAEVNICGTKC
tara:strand:- start:1033 stop:2259 length:1227 start_codon:yes stop_codon:yes gene_type:complete